MLRFLLRVAIVAGFFLVVFATHPAQVSAAETESVVVPQLTAPPHLQGSVDASWKGAAQLQLGWDFQYRRPAEESTAVYVAQYGQALYVAFQAVQREPVTATQHTDGPGVYYDDTVNVDLWPQGTQGFQYQFISTPVGTRYQSSSENSAYAPQWVAVGHPSSDGYTVTMRIPFDVIRSGGSTVWHAQFTRSIVVNGELDEWTHDPNQRGVTDVVYAGLLKGISLKGASSRPPARLQPYLLDEMAAKSSGGNTSRIGADFAVPITPTASLLGTLHPDYSNVETDQQSIAPQEFARFYQEVRPFFTQLDSAFNGHFGCINCPTTLYTPSIPTFSEGYAIEGTQGPASFGAFDAIGSQRTDSAQALGLFSSSREHLAQLSVQRVTVDAPQLHDDTTTFSTGYGFFHNQAFLFANGGQDRGTFVTEPTRARYAEYGFGVGNATGVAVVDYLHVGSQFAPVDGYNPHPPGISGLGSFLYKTFIYKPTSFVQNFSFNAGYDRYRNEAGAINQSDQSVRLNVQLRDLLSLGIGTGSSYAMTPGGELAPFNQNGISLSYRGGTSTATNLSYQQGRYYHGWLSSWYRSTTIPVAKRLLLSLEADSTAYSPDASAAASSSPQEIAARQVLERASLGWQLSSKASFDVGFRRIVGLFAPSGFGYVPVAGTQPLDASNLTAAFHFLALRNEFYVVYGDPNQLTTAHVLYLKWIRYIGAPKGT